jgi:hypothetical protein
MIQLGRIYNIITEFGMPRKLVGLIKICLDEIYSRVRMDKNLSNKFHIVCSELSSGIYCRVKLLSTDVSEVRTASIIRESRRMRWMGYVARMGEERKVYKVLVGKPEGKRPLGRPRHRWENGISMDLREVGWERVDWIHLAQDRYQWRAAVSTVMNL